MVLLCRLLIYFNFSWDLDFLEFTINDIQRKALIIVDHHSRRLLYARILVKPTAEKVAEIIEALIQHYKAVPLFVKADNGPEFRDQFKQLLVDLKINLFNLPRYYPQFNGVIERINREIRRKSIAFDLNTIKAVNEFLDKFLDYHNYCTMKVWVIYHQFRFILLDFMVIILIQPK